MRYEMKQKMTASDLEQAARGFEKYGGEFAGFDEETMTVRVKFESTPKMMVLIDQLKRVPAYADALCINSKLIDGAQHLTLSPR